MDSLFSDVEARLIPFKEHLFQLLKYSQEPRLLSLIDATLRKSSLKGYVGMDLIDLAYKTIKTMARPCQHPVDLRCYFDDCEKVEHNDLDHYLDSHAKTIFNKYVEIFGGLLPHKAAVAVQENAYSRYNEKPKKRSNIKDFDFVSTGLRRLAPLEHQKPEYQFRTLWFPFDPSSYSKVGYATVGKLVSIQRLTNKEIKLKRSDVEQIHTGNGFILMDSFLPETGLLHNCKIICKVEIGNDGTGVISNIQNIKDFNHYITRYQERFHEQLLKQKDILVENLSRVLLEQLTHKTAIPMLIITERREGLWIPTYGLASLVHGPIQAILSMGNAFTLFNNPQVDGLSDGDSVDGFIYRNTEDTSQFRFLTTSLLSDINAKQWNQLKDLCDNGLGRFVRVKKIPNPAKDAEDRSSLPDHCGIEFKYMNQPIPQVCISILNECKAFQLMDLTDLLPNKHENTDLAPLTKTRMGWLCPHVTKNDHSIKWHSFESKEERAEERFPVRYPLVIRSVEGATWAYQAVSTNISAHGARIRLKRTSFGSPGDFVTIDWSLQAGNRTLNVSQQPYQIIGIHHDDKYTEMRLQITDPNKPAVKAIRYASVFWAREMAGQHDPHLGHFGWKRILRNIQAANPWTSQYFLGKSKFGLFMDSEVQQFEQKIYNRKDLLEKITSTGMPEKNQHYKIWMLRHRKNNDNLILEKYVDISNLLSSAASRLKLSKLLKAGYEIGCCTVTKLIPGDSANSRDELLFLERISPQSAKALREREQMLSLRIDFVDMTSCFNVWANSVLD